MRFFLGLAVMLSGISAPALADNPADEDKIICKRDRDADLGSHMRAKKTCLKKSEWRELEQNAQDTMNRINERSGTRIPGADSGAASAPVGADIPQPNAPTQGPF